MINPSKKQIFAVYAVAAFLGILLIFSQTVFSKSNNKRHIQQLQLLHEADISNIDIITIQNNNNDAIILTRTDNMWLVANQNNLENQIPADTQRLQKFFVLLASKHNMTKAGKSQNTNDNSYGFDEEDGTSITLYKNGSTYQILFFGAYNFSQTERYFTTNEIKSVLLAGQEFDPYLSTSIQSWADPYIISKQLKDDVFKMGEPQSFSKLFELRHGGIADNNNVYENPETSFQIQMGDKSIIYLEIFQTDLQEDDAPKEYVVKTTFDSPRLSKNFSYYTKISLWTYNKIKEIIL